MRGIVLFSLLASLGVLSGCSQRVSPDLLRVAVPQEPDSVNPIFANLVAANVPIQLIFSGLVRFDDRGRTIPDLAMVVPSLANGGVSQDGRTVTYHLRRDALWQDGVPVTSADVVFTWHALMNVSANVPTREGYDQIDRIDTPDRFTVRLVFRRPYAPALTLFRCTKQGAILPAHLKGIGTIGSGPYRLLRWDRGDDMVFERNRYYWNPVRIKVIQVRFFGDQMSALNALRSGAVDLFAGADPNQANVLAHDSRFRVLQVPTLQWEHLSFNLTPGSGPQTSIHVRRAIAFAISPQEIRAKIYLLNGGLAPLDQGPFSWARDRQVVPYPYWVAKAREELRHAHLQVPVSVTLLTTSGTPLRSLFAVYLQAQLRQVGIELNIKEVAAPLLFATKAGGGLLFNGRFQLAYFSFETPTNDPDDRLYVASSSIPPDGQNISNYRDSAVTTWSRQAIATFNQEARAKLYARIQRRLIAAIPFYTVVWRPEIDISTTRLHGVRPAPLGSDFWNVADWRFSNARS